MTHQIRTSGAHHSFKLGISAGSDATHQKSQGNLLGAHRPLYFDGVSGSHQGEARRVYEAQGDQGLAV